MEFKEFACMLRSVIGGSYNTPIFVKVLFEEIISEDALSLLEDISINTFKSYYSGHTKITKIAQRIQPHIDPELFVNYLNSFPEATTERLCNTFKPNIEDINLYNATYKIAYFYEAILLSSASQKRKISSKKAKKIEGATPSENIDDNTTTMQQQINIVQNGNTNINMTNNGTVTIKL